MKIKPLANKLLVLRSDAKAKTDGGVILPDVARERSSKGKVISVGGGKQVKEGDLVFFKSYVGAEVKLNGKEHLVMDESDVLAVIED